MSSEELFGQYIEQSYNFGSAFDNAVIYHRDSHTDGHIDRPDDDDHFDRHTDED